MDSCPLDVRQRDGDGTGVRRLGRRHRARRLVVSSNSQIGRGTVSGHNPPSGKHANIIRESVNRTDIVPASVGGGSLADTAVTNPKIANGAVSTAKLATGSVATAKLQDASVTAPKLAFSLAGTRRAVADAPGDPNVCSTVARFCTGSNGWRWRNYGNGFQPVGFWKDAAGVVHLEGVAELFGGSAGGQPPAFILPVGYRPANTRLFPVRSAVDTNPFSTAVLRQVVVQPDGTVNPQLGGGGIAPLDGINFRP
jgi:hypothetical protein